MNDKIAVGGTVSSGRMTTDGGYTLTISFNVKEGKIAKAFEVGDAIAVAKITNEASLNHEQEEPEQKPAKTDGQKLVALAGSLSGSFEFWEYVEHTSGVQCSDKDTAASFIRMMCDIKSRKDLGFDAAAQVKFNALRKAYLKHRGLD